MQTFRLIAFSFLATFFLLPALSPAQSISIVSGNGQLVCLVCKGGPYNFAPLVVQVYDSTGKAVGAGTSVNWTATQQGGQPVNSSTTTNAAGQTSYAFSALSPFSGYLTAVIGATISSGASVNFAETTISPGIGGGPSIVPALETANGAPPTLSGMAGTPSSTAITVSVAGFPAALSGIAVQLTTGTTTGPQVTCGPQTGAAAGAEPGVVLTNSLGVATCTPVFSGTAGSGQYKVVVGGGFVTFGPTGFTVTPGVPGMIKYVSGNNQSVPPGTLASGALVAEVTDSSGDPSNGAGVKWTVSPSSNATLSSVITSSSSTGLVSAKVTPTGPATVTVSLASNSAVQYTFTVNVSVAVTGLNYSSGNNQQAPSGTAFANPLTVEVVDNGQPVNGVSVNFAVTNGPVTINANSAISEGGFASVDATAGILALGAAPTPAAVTASLVAGGKTYSYTFALTVVAPGPQITSVVNSAGATPSAASPCGLATIYGTGLADGLQGVVTPFIAPQTQLAGVTVQFGSSEYAPILYVANTNNQQAVSVQVPCTAVVGTAVPMAVTVDGATSTFDVAVTPYSPGIFQFTDYDNQSRAILISAADGTLVTVGNSATGVPPNPARPGGTYRMFVTGLGQTSPPIVSGELDPLTTDSSGNLVPLELPVSANLLAGVGGSPVTILAAHYAYGMVGVYEVDIVIPVNAAGGNEVPVDIVAYQTTAKLYWGNIAYTYVQ